MTDVSGEILASVIKCVNFAALKHKDQRRKDPEKTPYINHPIGKKPEHNPVERFNLI